MERPELAALLARLHDPEATWCERELHWLDIHRLDQYAGVAKPQVLQRNRRLLRETLRLDARFKDEGMEPIHYKGAALAIALDGHLKGRRFNDVDILVAPDEALRAMALLEADGFVPQVPYHGQEKRLLKNNFENRHIHQDGRVVEVHWRLHHRWLPFPEMEDAQTRTLKVAGQDLRVLAPESRQMHTILHGFRSHWRRMQWLLDSVRGQWQGIDVRAEFDEAGLMAIHDLHDHLARWLSTNPPVDEPGPPGTEEVEAVWCSEDDAGMNDPQEARWMMQVLGRRVAPGLLWSRFAPGPGEQERLPLPRWAQGLHWATKGGRWLRRGVFRR